jgi:hypothetical protein
MRTPPTSHRILNLPVRQGPPKNEKDTTDFFLQERAVQRKKLQDSILSRQERAPDWYSKLKKTPEQIKEANIRLRKKDAEDREEEKRELIELL